MPPRARSACLVALASTFALTFAASAHAAKFCVHHAGCSAPSNNFPSIQAAIAHAGTDSALDTILVGAGTYHGPFSADSGNPVALIGVGDATVLDAPGSGDSRTTLNLADSSSSATSLAVIVPAGTGGFGVVAANTDRVKVSDTAASTAAVGLADLGISDRARVTITGAGSTGVNVVGRLRHARVSAGGTGVRAISGVVENSLIRLTAGGQYNVAIASGSFGSSPAIDQTTLIGPGDTESTGVSLSPPPGVFTSAASSGITLNGLVIRGFGHGLASNGYPYTCMGFPPDTTSYPCPQSTTVNVSYSDWDSSHDIGGTTPENQITSGAGNLHVAPQFRNPAGGDFRLRHTSPLIDAGDPAAPLSGDSTFDLNGAPRKVDGNRNGTAVVDMGALEVLPFFGLKTLVTLKLGASKIAATGPLPIVVSNANGFTVKGIVRGQTAGKIPVGKHKKRHVALQPKAFSVLGHRNVALNFGLPSKVSKQLKKKGEIAFALIATVHDPDGDTRTVPATVTVKLK